MYVQSLDFVSTIRYCTFSYIHDAELTKHPSSTEARHPEQVEEEEEEKEKEKEETLTVHVALPWW